MRTFLDRRLAALAVGVHAIDAVADHAHHPGAARHFAVEGHDRRVVRLGDRERVFESADDEGVAESLLDRLAAGQTDPVIFSHGAAIMVWTAMNVDNPDIGLLLSHPLGNTEEVVVTGNPTDGWMMQSYAGIPVSQNPSLLTQLFVNTRDLIVAPQTAVYNVVAAIGTLNLQNIVVAVADGVVSVVRAGVDFVVNSATDTTVTLMAAADRERPLHIKRIGTGAVTVQGAETIDGDPLKLINTRYTSLMLASTDAEWVIL